MTACLSSCRTAFEMNWETWILFSDCRGFRPGLVCLKMDTFNCFLTRGVGFEVDEGSLSLPGSCRQVPGRQKFEVV